MSSCYVYELPTTGSASYNELCVDTTEALTAHLTDATAARANVRAALKESKRTNGEKDYLKLLKILDDYLPQLYGIIASVAADDLQLPAEPSFSWRTTLSANLLHNSPRISLTGLHAELSFTLLTYAFVLSNLASSIVTELGSYEHDRHITDADRKAKDEKLNFAVNLLCRASGIFIYISEKVLPEWPAPAVGSSRPPDVSPEVTTALSKLALADAQSLAIRKLMSKSAYDSALTPGPPLPKSHPAPGLVAKLYLNVGAQYTSARSLAKAAGSNDSNINPELRDYLAMSSNMAQALSHKWLGVDAGEQPGGAKTGEAVGFLKWAKEELEGLKAGKHTIASPLRKGKGGNKDRLTDELESVGAFLNIYLKINNTIHFQPIPASSVLQTLVPAGRSVLAAKPFQPPLPAFGFGSSEDARRQLETVGIASGKETSSQGSYAGAGSYF